jgi:hypothetical protein
MEISDSPTGAHGQDMPDRDPLLDAALLGFARHFDRAEPPAQLTDAVMTQLACLRRAGRGGLAPEMQAFLKVVNGSPDLLAVLSGAGTQLDFVRSVHGVAATQGFRLQKGDIYALLQRGEAANDRELSDEALDRVAAAGSAVPVQFSTAPAAGVDGPGVFSWSFGRTPHRS